MQTHANLSHSTWNDRGIVGPEHVDFSAQTQQGAVGIAAIWLIFYLVIFGTAMIAGNSTATVVDGASGIIQLP